MFLTSILLACSLSAPVEDPKIVRLPHDWAVGTTYEVQLTKSREDFETGKDSKRASATMRVDVSVIAKSKSGFTYRWVFRKPEFADPEVSAHPLTVRIAGIVDGMTMDLSADETGSITGLADPEAMEKFLATAINAIAEEMQTSGGKSAAEVAKLKAMAAAVKGTAASNPYYRHPQMFYMPSGAELRLGEKNEYEDELPNPFGGEPIPSKAYLVLTRFDEEKNEAVIDWRQRIDPDRAGPILEKSIRAFMKRMGQEIPEQIPLSFDAIEDASTYVYDVATGIPKSVVASRTTIAGGKRRVETQEFTVTKPAPK
jgi:hypothetical protein